MQESKFKTILSFHGILLTVVEHKGIDYIPLKPIVEMLGTQWKTAREKAFFGDNCELYGTCELNEPVFNSFNTPRGTKKTVFILLESGETYLMRTNTNQVRRHGNPMTADYLLKLQKEWRKALHDYETLGFAVKPNLTSIDAIAKIDRIKNPELKRLAAEQANEEFGLDLPVTKQEQIKL